MIALLKAGVYRLIETRRQVKVLYLDDNVYALRNTAGSGEILVTPHAVHKTDCVLSTGCYRLYSVEDEPKLTGPQHLELEAGKDVWQGYLLLTGLPNQHKDSTSMVPTKEIIAGSPRMLRVAGNINTTATACLR